MWYFHRQTKQVSSISETPTPWLPNLPYAVKVDWSPHNPAPLHTVLQTIQVQWNLKIMGNTIYMGTGVLHILHRECLYCLRPPQHLHHPALTTWTYGTGMEPVLPSLCLANHQSSSSFLITSIKSPFLKLRSSASSYRCGWEQRPVKDFVQQPDTAAFTHTRMVQKICGELLKDKIFNPHTKIIHTCMID